MPSTRRVKSSVRTHRGRHARRPSAEQSSLGASKVGSHQASTLRSTKLLQHQHLILERINSSIENERSVEGVAQDCLQALLESTGLQRAAVYLEDEQSRQMQLLATKGDAGTRLPQDWEQVAARVVRSGRRFSADDRLAVPLKRRGVVQGVLAVRGMPGGKKLASKMATLVDVVALRLATALDHARVIDKYAHKITRIQQLEEVSRSLISPCDREEALRRSIEAAVKLVNAEAGSLLLYDERRRDLFLKIAVGDKGEHLKEVRLKIGQGIAGLVAQTGQRIMVNDAQHDPRVWLDVDLRTGFTTQRLLAVPVKARDTVIGVMEAVNKRDGEAFSQWDLEEFTSLSDQVAIALENAHLFEDAQGRIARLQKIQEISAVLNSSMDQNEIRRRAIEASTILMEAEAGSLLLLDEAAGELYFEVALGEKGEEVREIRLKVGEGIAGYVAQTGEPLIVNDVQNDPRFSRQADKRSGFITRSMVCVPVTAREKLLGVLQAINKKDGRLFGQENLQDFVSLGHQVGIAIENANLYEEINRLFEGFISASVLAIESRDPTTSGHSGRVASLTCGLAELVDRTSWGPYAKTTFTHEQMKEIRYAAVLHDFGKVGVRENVLVKAKKLFPGDLSVLKARFDFIKRTLEAQALRRKVEILLSGDRAQTAAVLAEIDEDLAKQITETDGILEFLLACNRPTVETQRGFERLDKITQLSYESFEGPQPYLSPEEVLTLSIAEGSLTAEERVEIESHVTHTYRFLSTIPWTKSLKNVPLIAYAHHEKLDGSGYPRQVLGDSLPVQTRMMTISDIYDALTASDRPYKSAVSAPKALEILEDEAKQGKLDSHLLQIFIDGKIYRRTQGD